MGLFVPCAVLIHTCKWQVSRIQTNHGAHDVHTTIHTLSNLLSQMDGMCVCADHHDVMRLCILKMAAVTQNSYWKYQ